MLKKLSAWLAAIGMNIQFVAFMAHAGVTFSLVTLFPRWWAVGAVVVWASWKEFYFDARNEVPKQTLADNVQDWLGYVPFAFLAARHAGMM